MDSDKFSWDHFDFDGERLFLGRGSFGHVLKAKWIARNRKHVAVKFACSSWSDYSSKREYLAIEAENLKKINGIGGIGNIIEYYGIIEEKVPDSLIGILSCRSGDDSFAMVMECFPGDNLGYDKRCFNLMEKFYILSQIASGLADLHVTGVIHGDIKPENVLLSVNHPPLVKLIDFGFSNISNVNLQNVSYGQSTLFETILPKGTLAYCAPEILKSLNDVNEVAVRPTRASDMYSFAIVCWELLAGAKPAPDKKSLLIGNYRPSLDSLPKEIPKVIIDMIVSCWDTDRGKRKPAIYCFKTLNNQYQLLESGKCDIFFSHRRCSKPFVSHIYHILVKVGYRVWYDDVDIKRNLGLSLIDGVKNSKTFLLCLEKDYLESKNCILELDEALKEKKEIILIIISDDVLPQNYLKLDPSLQLTYRKLGEILEKTFIDLSDLATDEGWKNEECDKQKLIADLTIRMGKVFDFLKGIGCLPNLYLEEVEKTASSLPQLKPLINSSDVIISDERKEIDTDIEKTKGTFPPPPDSSPRFNSGIDLISDDLNRNANLEERNVFLLRVNPASVFDSKNELSGSWIVALFGFILIMICWYLSPIAMSYFFYRQPPSLQPSKFPSPMPSFAPTPSPSTIAPTTFQPTFIPTTEPTLMPTTFQPTFIPTTEPTLMPTTFQPTFIPTTEPTLMPSPLAVFYQNDIPLNKICIRNKDDSFRLEWKADSGEVVVESEGTPKSPCSFQVPNRRNWPLPTYQNYGNVVATIRGYSTCGSCSCTLDTSRDGGSTRCGGCNISCDFDKDLPVLMSLKLDITAYPIQSLTTINAKEELNTSSNVATSLFLFVVFLALILVTYAWIQKLVHRSRREYTRIPDEEA